MPHFIYTVQFCFLPAQKLLFGVGETRPTSPRIDPCTPPGKIVLVFPQTSNIIHCEWGISSLFYSDWTPPHFFPTSPWKFISSSSLVYTPHHSLNPPSFSLYVRLSPLRPVFDFLALCSSDHNTTHHCALFSCLSSFPMFWRTPPPPPPTTTSRPAPTPTPPCWPSSLHPPDWTPLSGAGPGCQALSCECGCCDFLWAIRWAAAN